MIYTVNDVQGGADSEPLFALLPQQLPRHTPHLHQVGEVRELFNAHLKTKAYLSLPSPDTAGRMTPAPR